MIRDHFGMRGVSATLFEITLEMPVVALPNKLIMNDTEPRQWQITWMRAFGAQLRRTVVKNGKKTVEVVYLITSDRSASPETLAAWVRGHWHIENKLHWVRVVTYQEDKSLVRTGNAPRVMASPRSLAISLLRLDGQRTSPPPCPRPAAHARAASDRVTDFAGSLAGARS